MVHVRMYSVQPILHVVKFSINYFYVLFPFNNKNKIFNNIYTQLIINIVCEHYFIVFTFVVVGTLLHLFLERQ